MHRIRRNDQKVVKTREHMPGAKRVDADATHCPTSVCHWRTGPNRAFLLKSGGKGRGADKPTV